MTAPDAADEVIERLADELRAQAQGEAQFLEQMNIPPALSRHLLVQALRRAAIKLEARK